MNNQKTNLTLDEYLSISPYYHIAWKYMEQKGITDPSVADIFEAFHEIAKIDHRINKNKKEI